jgi:hypothetical protein
MAEKRPVIHPFFSMKKKKEIETTKHEETIDLSSSNDETHDEANTNIDASVAISDDQLVEEISSSSVNNQPEEHQSRCELVCCSSSTTYVRAFASEYQSTSTIDKRSCQESWFTTFSWLTFCKVRCYFLR